MASTTIGRAFALDLMMTPEQRFQLFDRVWPLIRERGGTLDDVWTHPFYAAIRKWQRDYGYREANESCDGQCGNWMAPCLIRDHHAQFMKIMGEHPDVRPLDDDAAAALDDPEYHAGLQQFDRDLEALTGPEWEERYRQGAGIPPAAMKRR